jgi:phosphoribosyl 1,2-cyclic phosphate phosphodiesterase
MRASVAVQVSGKTLVIDTGPDFREQTLRYSITSLDAVLYTHGHSDHTNGIDELRYIHFLKKELIPVWADNGTMQELQARFAHIFIGTPDGLYKPVVAPHVFETEQYGSLMTIEGVDVIPFWQKHGISGHSIGYRFGDLAYSTDVSGLDDAAFEALRGIKTWIVDCAQFSSDYVVVHPNFEVVRGWNERVRAERVILTHLTPKVDFEETMAKLPKGYEPAVDGMRVGFD